MLIVVSQTPSLAVVVKSLEQAKTETVVHEGFMRYPGQLDQSAVPFGQAFSEIVWPQIVILQDLPRGKIHHPEGRPSIESCALVEMSIDKDQTLCECIRIVRVDVNDFVAVCDCSRRESH